MLKLHNVIINQTSTGTTALHQACIQSNTDILCLLLQFNCNVNIRDNSGLTPLHFACQQVGI